MMIKRVSLVFVLLISFGQIMVSAAATNILSLAGPVFLADFFNPFEDVADEANSQVEATSAEPAAEEATLNQETFDPFANTATEADPAASETSQFAITIDGIERVAEYDTEQEHYVIYDTEGNVLGYSVSLTPPVSITPYGGSSQPSNDNSTNYDPFSSGGQEQATDEGTSGQAAESQTSQDGKGNPTTADNKFLVPLILVFVALSFIIINLNSSRQKGRQ
ncbi:MAG: hypothetical protein LBV08_10705 [Clostridiales bacterium]|nr:hypothetical protein [Clostridiales bacterium]